MTQRNTHDTIQWLREHNTEAELGYNPNGRCLQITREGRNIDAVYPSAFAAQHATPEKYRVHSIDKVRRGMVVYFDDPVDDNPFGHIVTVVGRVKNAPSFLLSSLLVRTNSVVSGETVVVKGDYFQAHWGDEFQFGATWLNGVELDLPEGKPPEKPIQKHGKEKLREIVKELDNLIEIQEKKGNTRAARALRRDKREVINTLEKHS